jgi:hypothetical protein
MNFFKKLPKNISQPSVSDKDDLAYMYFDQITAATFDQIRHATKTSLTSLGRQASVVQDPYKFVIL